jgi:hypothetical protein
MPRSASRTLAFVNLPHPARVADLRDARIAKQPRTTRMDVAMATPGVRW